jgi:hypothetical protein
MINGKNFQASFKNMNSKQKIEYKKLWKILNKLKIKHFLTNFMREITIRILNNQLRIVNQIKFYEEIINRLISEI